MLRPRLERWSEIQGGEIVVTPRSYTNHLCLADGFKGNTVCVLGSSLLSLFLRWRSLSPRALPEALEWGCYHCHVRGPRGSRIVPSGFFWLASRVVFLSSLLKRLKKWGGVGGRTFWSEKVVNILLVAGVTFKHRLKLSLSASVRAIVRLVCQFQCDIAYVSIQCFLDYSP